MARDKNAGFRLDLGEELEGELADFCAAYYGASKTEVIRQAVGQYIRSILANEPARRKRYEEERGKRGAVVSRIKLVSQSKDGERN
jgi:hypothetical protein